jgi:hypothetical protein
MTVLAQTVSFEELSSYGSMCVDAVEEFHAETQRYHVATYTNSAPFNTLVRSVTDLSLAQVQLRPLQTPQVRKRSSRPLHLSPTRFLAIPASPPILNRCLSLPSIPPILMRLCSTLRRRVAAAV